MIPQPVYPRQLPVRTLEYNQWIYLMTLNQLYQVRLSLIIVAKILIIDRPMRKYEDNIYISLKNIFSLIELRAKVELVDLFHHDESQSVG